MRSLRAAAAVLIFAGVLLVPGSPASAARTSGACQGSGSQAQVGVEDLHAFAGYMDCRVMVKCPKKHAGDCTISLKGGVTGSGLVGLVMSEAGETIGECSEPQSCEVAGDITLARGGSTEVSCYFGQGAAADVAISCEWSST